MLKENMLFAITSRRVELHSLKSTLIVVFYSSLRRRMYMRKHDGDRQTNRRYAQSIQLVLGYSL